MTVSVCDSGPLTHLYQIDCWRAFAVFSSIHTTTLVIEEVKDHVSLDTFSFATSLVLQKHDVEIIRLHDKSESLQPADISILSLALKLQPDFVLTDDLVLRFSIESRGLTPMGSIGVLIRAFRERHIGLESLERAIDGLFDGSTLYLSPLFKAFVRRQIDELRDADASRPS